MHILTLGLNHRTAPIEIREWFAAAPAFQRKVLSQLTERCGLPEAALLSTCNRWEIYAACDTGKSLEGAFAFLAEVHGVDPVRLKPHLYEFSDGDAVQHLFGVACGIDSLVIGESQILKQVRDALEMAQENGSARLLLNEIFQRSLRVGKRARTETDIGRGRLSVGTAAVELACQIFDSLDSRSALLIGAGKMGELTAQYLVDSGIGRLYVTNRTPERARSLARCIDGEAVDFADLAVKLQEVDVVISSTAAPGFVIPAGQMRQTMRQRRSRPLFLIDIAVPRDIDPQVRDLDNVFLFDIDDLKQVVESNRGEREVEVLKVQQLIREEIHDFLLWFNALGTGPLVKALRRRAEVLRQVELDRWMAKLSHLSEQDLKSVEGILRGYGNKLLHDPLVRIREFANDEDGYIRLDTVQRLFNLDTSEEGNEEK